VLLARESVDRSEQVGNQLTDLRARVPSIGGRIDREVPENAVSAFRRRRVLQIARQANAEAREPCHPFSLAETIFNSWGYKGA
jgi:hypothetical protein